MSDPVVPLIVHGRDVVLEVKLGQEDYTFASNLDVPNRQNWRAQGASPALCTSAVESCARAFSTWKDSPAHERRTLLQKLAQVFRDQEDELKATVQSEICCSPLWANANYKDCVNFSEHAAALCTSGALDAVVPEVAQPGSHAVVYRAPLGVVLGIAPWNAPATLGLRAVLAAVATGNCVILKGSELCPRTHYFIADAFRKAGFPPGVVNFVLHRPQDAAEMFETMISHPEVRKCSFTGSTQVGRQIAIKAASFLKPVLMELGGKNFAIVLDDANLDKAADAIIDGALLNNGHICMSTDLVLVTEGASKSLVPLLRRRLEAGSRHVDKVITSKSSARILALIEDAKAKGAKCHSIPGQADGREGRATFLEGVTPEMTFWHEEASGPLFGVATIRDADQAIDLVNSCPYGLSAAMFTTPNLTAVALARRLEVGAVHINGATAHDESTLPHGGMKHSGWGRFGSHWGFDQFLQTQTVVLNED